MSRRAALARLESSGGQHPGLWLERYIRAADGDDEAKRDLVREAAGARESTHYPDFFELYKAALGEAGAWTVTARCAGRLAVGLGAEGVLETAIALHRTYGVPMIPGSALKGLASSYAHRFLDGENWRKGGEDHRELFGDTARRGAVTFFDALPLPGEARLAPDVLTVHHQDYYNKFDERDPKPPADWDSPVPVPFVSATGDFLVALAGPQDWVSAAYDILALALAEEGVGAKTSSGYGRLALENPIRKAAAARSQALDALLGPFRAINRLDGAAGTLPQLVARLEAPEVGSEDKRAAAKEMLERLRQEKVEKKYTGKPWFNALKRMAEEP